VNDVVVDSNVPIVANDRDGDYAPGCAIRCIERLATVRDKERVVLDFDDAILAEYKNRLRSCGQPGPGDAFLNHILRHLGDGVRTRLVALTKHVDRLYDDFPVDESLLKFDKSDRKFVAAAIVTSAPVLNAVDSDWLDHEESLSKCGVTVEFVCDRSASQHRKKKSK